MTADGLQKLKQDYSDIFTMYDRDHDGFLNKQEFTTIMRGINPTITESDIDAMIKPYLKEGKMTFESFCKVYNGKIVPENPLDQ
jgi:Ca2+-binding EF-hand superfamily protein